MAAWSVKRGAACRWPSGEDTQPCHAPLAMGSDRARGGIHRAQFLRCQSHVKLVRGFPKTDPESHQAFASEKSSSPRKVFAIGEPDFAFKRPTKQLDCTLCFHAFVFRIPKTLVFLAHGARKHAVWEHALEALVKNQTVRSRIEQQWQPESIAVRSNKKCSDYRIPQVSRSLFKFDRNLKELFHHRPLFQEALADSSS